MLEQRRIERGERIASRTAAGFRFVARDRDLDRLVILIRERELVPAVPAALAAVEADVLALGTPHYCRAAPGGSECSRPARGVTREKPARWRPAARSWRWIVARSSSMLARVHARRDRPPRAARAPSCSWPFAARARARVRAGSHTRRDRQRRFGDRSAGPCDASARSGSAASQRYAADERGEQNAGRDAGDDPGEPGLAAAASGRSSRWRLLPAARCAGRVRPTAEPPLRADRAGAAAPALPRRRRPRSTPTSAAAGPSPRSPRVERVGAGVQQLVRLALFLRERAPGPFDVRARLRVGAVEEQHARPDVDRELVLAREVVVETGEQQLFDPGVAITIRRSGSEADQSEARRSCRTDRSEQSSRISRRHCHAVGAIYSAAGRALTAAWSDRNRPWRSSNRSRTSAKGAVLTWSNGSCARSAPRLAPRLLDYSSDASHNRSVLTLVGDAGAAQAGDPRRSSRRRCRAIDLRTQRGEHPRVGAVDVVPFVPIEGVTMADCVSLARDVGAAVAERFGIPMYLYEEASDNPARKNLEDIRRGEFEGLAAKMASPEWTPDFGPPRRHESAGARVIGARMPLIAYNINLNTDRLDVAKKIAGRHPPQQRRSSLCQGDGRHAGGSQHRPGVDQPDQLPEDADPPRLRPGRARSRAIRRDRPGERDRRPGSRPPRCTAPQSTTCSSNVSVRRRSSRTSSRPKQRQEYLTPVREPKEGGPDISCGPPGTHNRCVGTPQRERLSVRFLSTLQDPRAGAASVIAP